MPGTARTSSDRTKGRDARARLGRWGGAVIVRFKFRQLGPYTIFFESQPSVNKIARFKLALIEGLR